MTAHAGAAPASSHTVRPAEKGVERNGVRRRLVTALTEIAPLSWRDARRIVDDRLALGETPDEVEAYLRATFRIDPTGTTAVRNVTRERGW